MSLAQAAGHGATQTARGAHAAEVAAKTNDVLGKAAQTGGTPTAQPMNVWTQTYENTGQSAETGLQPVMTAGTALSKIAPGLGQGMAAAAAVVSAAAAIRGAAKAGVHRSTLADVGTAQRQQGAAIADQVLQLLHLSDDPTKPPPEGVLGHIAAGFGLLTSIEQLYCLPLAMIPTPALPAVRILDTDIGMPHAHMHPPNLTPPNPVPVPLPSTGPVIPIPYVSGASTVLINGMPAARCGDMGLGVFCGGFFPMFEIFLGSSSVWLEGNRAARVGTDITKHCMFSNPKSIAKSTDVPIGPMIGTTVAGSVNVLIGGFPLPSLSGMAIGAAFKALFNQLAKLAKKVKSAASKFSRADALLEQAASKKPSKIQALIDKFKKKPITRPAVSTLPAAASQKVDDLLAKGKIVINDGGDAAFRQAVKDDLTRIANNPTGTKTLDDIAKAPHPITIEKYDKTVSYGGRPPDTVGAHLQPANAADCRKPGAGSPSTVRYDPTDPAYAKRPGSPSDATLHHELAHGRNSALGENVSDIKNPPGQGPVQKALWKDKWSNLEEHDVITQYDNPYRQAEGLPQRKGHNHLPFR